MAHNHQPTSPYTYIWWQPKSPFYVSLSFLPSTQGTYVGLFTIGVCWLWPDYVDNTEARRVRRILIRLAMLLSLEEWVLYMADVISAAWRGNKASFSFDS